jgi:hypothetical protein
MYGLINCLICHFFRGGGSQLERSLADAQRAKRAAADAADAASAELGAAQTAARTAAKEAEAAADELRTRIVVLETEIETVRSVGGGASRFFGFQFIALWLTVNASFLTFSNVIFIRFSFCD